MNKHGRKGTSIMFSLLKVTKAVNHEENINQNNVDKHKKNTWVTDDPNTAVSFPLSNHVTCCRRHVVVLSAIEAETCH